MIISHLTKAGHHISQSKEMIKHTVSSGNQKGGLFSGLSGVVDSTIDRGSSAIAGLKDNIPTINTEDVKGFVTDTVTRTAEFSAQIYEEVGEFSREHPLVAGSLIHAGNFLLDPLAQLAEKGIDTNPETLGWTDLGAIWLLETEVQGVGSDGVIEFDENARTTQDLKNQEGVQDARNEALQQITEGNLENGRSSWSYDVEAYYESIQEKNLATAFLGSYSTQYEITENGDGTYTINYTVENTSGWESGTRFRQDVDGDGVNNGIIPNKERGDGAHLGGNVTQRWTWSEKVTAEDLQNL